MNILSKLIDEHCKNFDGKFELRSQLKFYELTLQLKQIFSYCPKGPKLEFRSRSDTYYLFWDTLTSVWLWNFKDGGS